MTKAEIVKSIADTTGLDRQEVLQVVEAFMDTVKNAMSQGDCSQHIQADDYHRTRPQGSYV